MPRQQTPALQKRIDAVRWYHEFDFPNGLMARSKMPYVEDRRIIWKFIEKHLGEMDFRGRSVLEIGCWDGYWSFYAEKRGAASVLATDDRTQNWAASEGLLLAKELLGSSVETRLDVSVYDLDSLGRKFDMILCLGVYYHLVDPFYAFSQIRHRCHDESVVILEGDVHHRLRPGTAFFDLIDHSRSIFVPSIRGLNQLLMANYLRPLKNIVTKSSKGSSRCLTICAPFAGVPNPLHYYKPPFGLAAYDPRFSDG